MHSTMASQTGETTPPSPSLSNLPSELLLHILTYLDIPDLLSLTRTSHPLRTLSLDPLLHRQRLHRASLTLKKYIPIRPPLTQLLTQRIYITRTTLAARSLGRSLVAIKLNRMLGGRHSVEELVGRGVLPGECEVYRKGRGGGVAPGLVEMRRRVERERVRDFLRGWVGEWAARRRRGGVEHGEGEGAGEKADVRRLARRFLRGEEGSSGSREGRDSGPRWGRRVEAREMPTRAKVLGLRRFWEKVGREGAGSM